jgi:hypothetical protein
MLDDAPEEEGKLVPATQSPLVNSAEVDMQIATARRYPRAIKDFRNEALALATLNENVAAECSYALIRKEKNGEKKTIVGPSARFAEIVASAWGNCRAGARVVDEQKDFVVAQGAFVDLQKNVAITYEVQRRIVDSKGRRYSADMIGVTANAACSIALRNAILKGVPKALWSDLWEQARTVAQGDVKTLSNRRANAVKKFAAYGVTEQMLLAKIGRKGIEDVTPDDLGILLGFLTTIKEGDATPEQLFADETPPEPESAAVAGINESIRSGAAPAAGAAAA